MSSHGQRPAQSRPSSPRVLAETESLLDELVEFDAAVYQAVADTPTPVLDELLR